MKKLFASGGSDLELEVLSDLVESRLLDLVGVLTWKKKKGENLPENLQGVFLVCAEEMIFLLAQGRWPDDMKNHIGIDTLSLSGAYESNFLGMMDRVDTKKNISYLHRRYAFWYLINYWSDFLKSSEVDVVYFNSVPHEMVDYILFAVCEVTGVETAMWLAGASIGGKRLERSWKGPWGSKGLASVDYPIEKSLTAANAVLQAQGTYDTAEPASSVIYKREITAGSKLSPFTLAIKLLRKAQTSLVLAIRNEKTGVQNLANDFGLGIFQSIFMNLFAVFNQMFDAVAVYLDNWLSRRLFDRVSVNELPKGSYVAFFLHYQPEMTVNPLGDVGGDQLIPLASLSKTIPSDWEIVIKEHPIQFHKEAAGYFTGRDKHFYQRILALGNTRIVSGKVDTFEMIDKCIAVSTVTGTAAWEAVCRHKPSIIFGHVWYGSGPGVFRIREESDLRAAVLSIERGEVRIDDDELSSFVNSEAQKYVKIAFSESLAALEGIEWDYAAFKSSLRDELLSVIYPGSQQTNLCP